MKYFFIPINLNHWSLFEQVNSFGFIESFYATSEMSIGDMMFFYITNNNMGVPSGIYGNGIITTNPKVDTSIDEKLRVMVKIKFIKIDSPIINFDECKKYFKQFRSVHKIDESIINELKNSTLINIMNL